MKRLTWQNYDMCQFCGEGACCEHYCDNTFPVCDDKAIYDRLAAYEDTGLEPEEIKRIYQEWSHYLNFAGERNAIEGAIEDIYDGGNIDYNRLRELAQADREGRVVVLPCKVGDTLYDIYEAMGNGTGEIRELKVTDIHIHLDKRSKEWLIAGGYYFSLSDFGKTVFLTREDAEAALRREQDEQ